ncbi:hypothetical protein [Actinomadura sp. HBU206391]|uniref:hypothetical protein n=1 Tax=Actinomadura sp. HBU206391 TaxID=2731692 RepID=UPI00164F8C4D|nr:hypothetical protein [Actinomadura sp. HBU206391]MBC6462804.1 hypothetical protein [Actinomadura sp. HBU206391]
MALNTIRAATSAGDTDRPVPRWAVITAHAVPLVVLPSSLWRLPIAFNFAMGQIDPAAPGWRWFVVPYVFGLSLLTEGLALLTFGLVRKWGEVAPAWIPWIGGKRIPPVAAIIPATLGGLILTVLWGYGVLGYWHIGGMSHVEYTNGWWHALATVCITPLALWGPMLLVVTYAYHVRRRRPVAADVPPHPVT